MFLKDKILHKENEWLPSFLLILLFFMLISPFFFLSFFDYPSIDDYAFWRSTNVFGIWQSQINWYMGWTGRYSSSFLLSTHPLLTHSFAVYKLIAIIMIGLTIHSFYIFVKFILPSAERLAVLFLVTVLSFCFLNGMPSLVQGIYWFPASVTYHFGNILTLYLTIKILVSANLLLSRFQKFKIFALIFIVCGLNETSMIALDVLLVFIFAHGLLFTRVFRRDLFLFILFATACSLIVVLAPRNAKRDLDFTSEHKHQLFFTLTHSFIAAYDYIKYWLQDREIMLSSVLVFTSAFFIVPKQTIDKKGKIIFLLFLAFTCFTLIAMGFIAGFWSIGAVSPTRTINVCFWFFIFIWFSILISAAPLIKSFFKITSTFNLSLFSVLGLILLLIFNKKTDNYHLAVKDLLSGDAYVYAQECNKRDEVLRQSKDSIPFIPAFSAFPKSIFNDDIQPDGNSWFNNVYAQYYNKVTVKVFSQDHSSEGTYFFNFESGENKLLKNIETITNDVSFSAPSSSAIGTENRYSCVFSKEISGLSVTNFSLIKKAHLSVALYSDDSIINAALVLYINHPNASEFVLWKSKEIVASNYKMKQWKKEEAEISLEDAPIEPEDIINVYMWNRGKSKIYIDDLQVDIKK